MPTLIFIAIAKACGCCRCQMYRGFYRASWQLPEGPMPPAEELNRLHKHPLFGVTVCVN